MNKKIRTAAVETLFNAIIKLETVDECFDFFEDLATINEILSLSQRFEVARMLRQHKTYLEIAEKTDTRFACNCSRERVSKALISIGEKEIKEMIDEGKPIEMNCHFCNTSYTFQMEELKQLLAVAKKR